MPDEKSLTSLEEESSSDSSYLPSSGGSVVDDPESDSDPGRDGLDLPAEGSEGDSSRGADDRGEPGGVEPGRVEPGEQAPKEGDDGAEEDRPGEAGSDSADPDEGFPDDLVPPGDLQDDPEGLGDLDFDEPEGESSAQDDSEEVGPNDEGFSDPKYLINLKAENVAAGTKSVVAGFYAELNAERQDGFIHLAPEEWEHLEPVFVPSLSCEALPESPDTGRLLFVIGPEHAGKRATALYLAAKYRYLSQTRSRVFVYHPAEDGRTISLSKLIHHEDVPKGALLLVEDAFEIGISSTEIRSLQRLKVDLAKRESFLVLTSERGRGDLPGGVPSVSAQLTSERLLGVLEQGMDRLDLGEAHEVENLRNQVRESWSSLSRDLDAPYKIHRLLRRLVETRKSEVAIHQVSLTVLVREAIDPGPLQLTEWFSDLGPNGRFLAFLTVFFPELPKPELMRLYWTLIQWIRQAENSLFEDPRTQGFEDLLTALGARARDDRIRLEPVHRQREVRSQVGNHYMLLRSATELMLERFQDLGGQSRWQLLKGLGRLVGRLGCLDRDWLVVTLENLATDDDRRLRTIASYAMEPIVEWDLQRQSGITLNILGVWCRADQRNLRRTAGSALWQAYQSLKQNSETELHGSYCEEFRLALLALLRVLGTHRWGNRTKKQAHEIAKRGGAQSLSVIRWRTAAILRGWRQVPCLYPLLHILLTDPAGAASTLTSWMEEEKDWRDLMIEAMPALLGVFSTLDACLEQDEDRRDQMIESMPALTEASSASNLSALTHFVVGLLASTASIGQKSRDVFFVLRQWCEADRLREGVLRALSAAVHRSTLQGRQRLRLGLARTWLGSAEHRLQAREVVARSWTLDGLGVGPSSTSNRLLIVDTSLAQDDDSTLIVDYLKLLLDSISTLHVAHLGSTNLVGFDHRHGQRPRAAPRLLLPILEGARNLQLQQVIVLAAGPMLDLDDLASVDVCPISVIYLGAEPPDDLQSHPWVSISRHTKGVGEHSFGFLDSVVAEASWRRPTSAPDRSVVGLHSKQLHESLVSELVSFETTLEVPGPFEHFRSDLLGLCETDLDRAVSIACGWLSSKPMRLDGSAEATAMAGDLDQEVVRAVGGCLARSLLAWSAHIDPPEDRSRWHQLFDPLLHHYIDTHPSEGSHVIDVLLSWLEDPWWRAYLAGDAELGRGRLRRFADELAEGERRRLQAHLGSLTTPEAEDLRRQFGEAGDQPPRETLPALNPPARRGLVFVDSGSSADYWQLGHALVQAMEDSSAGSQIVPSLFQVGCSDPVWKPGTTWVPQGTSYRPPPTLGPVLEQDGVSVEETEFVLLLGRVELIDKADWQTKAWAEKIFQFSAGRLDKRGEAVFEDEGLERESQERLADILMPYLRRAGNGSRQTSSPSV